MFEITKRFMFEAAHQLPWHQGKCHNLHGHSYKLEVTLGSENLDTNGVVLDFDILSQIVDEVTVKRYDHKYLNDFFDNPTAENMAAEIFKNVSTVLAKNQEGNGLSPITVKMVRLWETEKCSVTVTL